MIYVGTTSVRKIIFDDLEYSRLYVGNQLIWGESQTDRIYYTSTDGSVVTPYSAGTETFGANIISNTYNEGIGCIIFDGNVTKIGDEAFYNCNKLKTIQIPSPAVTFGNDAFANCTNLQNVSLSNVMIIHTSCFYRCTGLRTIVMPNVSYIGAGAFDNCTGLSSITISSNSIPYFGGHSFDNTNNCPIYVPASLVDSYKSTLVEYADRIQPIP